MGETVNLGRISTKNRCLWRTALQHFYLDCRYCNAHVVMEAVEARPVWRDKHYQTKSRWAIYRHLKAEHPDKFAVHFGAQNARHAPLPHRPVDQPFE